MAKEIDLTTGNITASLWRFAVPMMLGNVLQQCYNLVDTWVVGRYVGENALAAVGTSYTLMTFLTSVIIGLCLGSSAFISMAYGRHRQEELRNGLYLSFVMIGGIALVLMGIMYGILHPLIHLLMVPEEAVADMTRYLQVVFFGFLATFLYNYAANVLRSIGNSFIPLVFLGISVVLNIGLDIYFVVVLHKGVTGAAVATVIAQYISGVGMFGYFKKAYPQYRVRREDRVFHRQRLKQILSLSGYTCLQQSVMNFGILVVQEQFWCYRHGGICSGRED